MKNERSLNWCLVLYPNEDPTHKKALDYIIQHFSYAYIIHDKDILDDGSLKKEHCHVVIKFNNYRWRNAVKVNIKMYKKLKIKMYKKCNQLCIGSETSESIFNLSFKR